MTCFNKDLCKSLCASGQWCCTVIWFNSGDVRDAWRKLATFIVGSAIPHSCKHDSP
jgi:hypothetical protein